MLSPRRGPDTPHLNPTRGSPVRSTPPIRHARRRGGQTLEEGVLERVGHTEMPSKGTWDASASGMAGVAGKDFLQLGPTNSALRRPGRGSIRKGLPAPHNGLPGRLPPRAFTYEVAHGGRKRIPVTLSKRHGSPSERGPGKTPPRSRAPPARCAGSSSPPDRFPGSGGG